MPNETEERDEIVVVGKRGSKPTPEPQLVINFGEFGRAAPSVTSNPIIDFLRSIINTETDFYISNEFGSNQRKIIVTAIAGISNHPSLASAFSALKAKGAVINIRPVHGAIKLFITTMAVRLDWLMELFPEARSLIFLFAWSAESL